MARIFRQKALPLPAPSRPELIAPHPSGFVTAGLVEFLLRWLEQTDNEEIFGGILGMLCRLPSMAHGSDFRS
jgi:hypothetical protein